ncbi:hypothetical protein BDV24DRAFT_161295 [Aspergillus arachidicola]|uniref:Uncharacterized protein n=1 Tax=Aspergillus arachidicola TaxID=656916 RepID=A0A5N6YJC4_9EURO|nr:hypothetical protein BDV24DRAFT_161295 [Aspergillus arachidicola]
MHLTTWASAPFTTHVLAKGIVHTCRQNETYPDCGWYGEWALGCDGTLDDTPPQSRKHLIANTVGKLNSEDLVGVVSEQCLYKYGLECRWWPKSEKPTTGKLLWCANAEE